MIGNPDHLFTIIIAGQLSDHPLQLPVSSEAEEEHQKCTHPFGSWGNSEED